MGRTRFSTMIRINIYGLSDPHRQELSIDI